MQGLLGYMDDDDLWRGQGMRSQYAGFFPQVQQSGYGGMLGLLPDMPVSESAPTDNKKDDADKPWYSKVGDFFTGSGSDTDKKDNQPSWRTSLTGVADNDSAAQNQALATMFLSSAGAMANANRRGMGYNPSLGDIFGAGLGGFGQGMMRAQQMGLYSANNKAKAAAGQAQLLTAQQKAAQQQMVLEARQRIAQGQAQPGDYQIAAGDAYFNAMGKGMAEEGFAGNQMQRDIFKNMAGKGMAYNPLTGEVTQLPGFAAANAGIAGTEAMAKGLNTPQSVQPGGQVVIPAMAMGAMPYGQTQPIERQADWYTPPEGAGKELPRGIRNNNAGNLIKTANRWDNEVEGIDPKFKTFATPEAGIAAAVKNLTSYDKRGINTIGGMTNLWAPPNENDTKAYAEGLAKKLGIGVNDKINFRDPEVLKVLLPEIFRRENGQVPYPESQIMAGINMGLGRAVAGRQDSIPTATPAVYNSGVVYADPRPAPGTPESAMEQAIGKQNAELIGTGIKNREEIEKGITALNAFETLLNSGYETGVWADVKGKVAQIGQALGINLGDAANYEQARGILARFALDEQMKQKGVQTDKDYERILTALPALKNTPEGNRMLINYLRGIHERSLERADFLHDQIINKKADSYTAIRRWDKKLENMPSLVPDNFNKLVSSGQQITKPSIPQANKPAPALPSGFRIEG